MNTQLYAGNYLQNEVKYTKFHSKYNDTSVSYTHGTIKKIL